LNNRKLINISNINQLAIVQPRELSRGPKTAFSAHLGILNALSKINRFSTKKSYGKLFGVNEYSLLDSGNGQKLERFGPYLLIRPCAQAVWRPALSPEAWQEADALFEREDGNSWIERKPLPEKWTLSIHGIQFFLKRTDFGHLGIFPEQISQWLWMQKKLESRPQAKVLNLFAYSGGATFAAAQKKAEVCHLDAAKGMVAWARENAALNGLEEAPIRWIVDDVSKFLVREKRRGQRYDAIILDPPSFGRGAAGEVFKIERDLPAILQSCKDLLSENPLFVLFSCHTPSYTPIVMRQLLGDYLQVDQIESGEMVLEASQTVPSGTYARWSHGC